MATAMCGSTRLLFAFYRRDGQRLCAAVQARAASAYGNARIPAYEMIRFSVNISAAALAAALSVLSPSTKGALSEPFGRFDH